MDRAEAVAQLETPGAGPSTLRADPRPPRRLPSGAGHDAMMMARLAPMAMLFVRCGNGGISHHPEEQMTRDDAQRAADVFGDFLTRLGQPS